MTALSNQPTLDTVSDGPQDLLAALLAESRELTAVERFAKAHDAGAAPAQAKHYRDLIPLSAPEAGQQYAFDVDLDACSGCKACVSACHHLNGLEPEETWRQVGQLHGENGLPIIQHVTSACHHCVDPRCMQGCPTNAYEKDPTTGVVRHLDDQCFGCQYCTMTCPYEVPQYSEAKGIVRKCDMCHGRLAAGEAPACVQACPSQAIRITVVDVQETVQRTDADRFLPGTPHAGLTHPTTIYRGGEHLPADLKPADDLRHEPQHAHLPLVMMLVLTQLSVGAVAAGALARWGGMHLAGGAGVTLGTLAGLVGLSLATLHLGRPHLAFRSILGWRHSWLSREAIVFGVYAPLAIGAAAFAVLPYVEQYLPEAVLEPLRLVMPPSLRGAAEALAVVAGLAGVYCSAKIYIFTKRTFWQGGRTYLRFFGVAALLGPSLVLATATTVHAWQGLANPAGLLLTLVVVVASAKLVYELAIFTYDDNGSSLASTAKLMKVDLRGLTALRFGLGLLGGLLLPAALALTGLDGWLAAALAIGSFCCLLLGELAERTLYFSAVVPLRMPGGFKP